MTTIVTTQAELDNALDAGREDIIIDSPAGIWLSLDRGVVQVRGASSVGPVGGSATVSDVGGSATVHLHDAARATRVGSHVAVHLHSARAHSDGGVIIDVASLDLTDAATWCDYHAVRVDDGTATLYKAVDDSWTTSRGTDYAPGTTPVAADWRDDNTCGGGLHFCPQPLQSQTYHRTATRYVEVGVALADLRPINDGGGAPKAKAPRVVRACREVNKHGEAAS